MELASKLTAWTTDLQQLAAALPGTAEVWSHPLARSTPYCGYTMGLDWQGVKEPDRLTFRLELSRLNREPWLEWAEVTFRGNTCHAFPSRKLKRLALSPAHLEQLSDWFARMLDLMSVPERLRSGVSIGYGMKLEPWPGPAVPAGRPEAREREVWKAAFAALYPAFGDQPVKLSAVAHGLKDVSVPESYAVAVRPLLDHYFPGLPVEAILQDLRARAPTRVQPSDCPWLRGAETIKDSLGALWMSCSSREFYRQHPDCAALFEVSRVGFHPDGKWAGALLIRSYFLPGGCALDAEFADRVQLCMLQPGRQGWKMVLAVDLHDLERDWTRYENLLLHPESAGQLAELLGVVGLDWVDFPDYRTRIQPLESELGIRFKDATSRCQGQLSRVTADAEGTRLRLLTIMDREEAGLRSDPFSQEWIAPPCIVVDGLTPDLVEQISRVYAGRG